MGKFYQETLSCSLLLFLGIFSSCYAITSTSPVKRQGTVPVGSPPPGFPSEELLPPPALSASFPTLRPRIQNQNPPVNNNNNNNGRFQQPPLDLVPPFRPPQGPSVQQRPAPQGPPPQRHIPRGPPPQRPAPQNAAPPTTPLPLLPPIEIPPERPLTENEIQASIIKETSFSQTTGQGVSNLNIGLTIPQGVGNVPNVNAVDPNFVIRPSVQENPTTINDNSSSIVRFPSDADTSANLAGPPNNCPSCECTNEMDYICASNGVLYLNSCSFDCATFCDAGLQKIDLKFCTSGNQK